MISAISLCDSVAKIVFHYFFLIKSSDQQKRLNLEIAAEITKNGDLVFVMFATISNNYFIKCIASYQTAERTNDGSRYHKQRAQTVEFSSLYRSPHIRMPQYSLILRILLSPILFCLVIRSVRTFRMLFDTYSHTLNVDAHNSLLRSWQHWHTSDICM